MFAPGYNVGLLDQEPELDPDKTVLGGKGAKEVVAVLDRYNEINDAFGLPEVYENQDKMEALMNEQAKLQDEIDAVSGTGN